MLPKIKVNLAALLFVSTLTSPYGANAQVNTILTQKNCSGRISDMNCYQDIIKKQAHMMNVHDGYVKPTAEDLQSDSFSKATYEGRQILVDIQDQESCQQVAESLKQSNLSRAKNNSLSLNQLCQKDPNVPNERYRAVTLMWETEEQYLTSLNLNFLTNTDKNLGTDTRNLSYLMMATMGVLWMMPESVSKWKKDEIREEGFVNKWKSNASRAPVMDEDAAYLNFVGHPISGAIYYTVARSNGLSRMQSFGYSVVMSTFFWEYGFEALAEKPSIQDLIITPVLGSLLGELFYQWGEKIKANDGKVLGHKSIGSVVMFVLNPADKLSRLINRALDQKFIQTAQSNLVLSRKRSLTYPGVYSNYIGVELKFAF